MILARVGTLSAVLAVSFGATLAASIRAYAVGTAAGDKAGAETSLFLGLLAAGTQLVLTVVLFAGARKKRKEFESLADIVRFGGEIPADRLNRFGPLGDRIRVILKELSDASDRKGARIASLTGLLRAVFEMVDRPVLATTPDGRIVEASRGAREDERLAGLEVGTARIEDLFPDIDARSVLQEADRSHSSVERPGKAVFHPVYSVRGEIGHFLVDLSRSGGDGRISLLKRGSEQTGTQPKPAGGGWLAMLRKQFGRYK